jgi:hypothetical protein
VDSEDEDIVLTEIEARVAANNARLRELMKQKNLRDADIIKDLSIATLKIPPKNKLKTEGPRLLVRILSYEHGQYKLQSRWGRLSGQYQPSELRAVTGSSAEVLGASIPIEPEFQRGQEVVISLSAAVARENNCESIASIQKASRAANRAGNRTGNRTVVDEQDAPNTPITEIDGSPLKPSTRTGRQRQGRAVAGPSTRPKPD